MSSLKAKCISEAFGSMESKEQYETILSLMKSAGIESMICVSRSDEIPATATEAQVEEDALKKRFNIWIQSCLGEVNIPLHSMHLYACFRWFIHITKLSVGVVFFVDGNIESKAVYMTTPDDGRDFEDDAERKLFFSALLDWEHPRMINLCLELPPVLWVISFRALFQNVHAHKGDLSPLMHLFGYRVRVTPAKQAEIGVGELDALKISAEPAFVKRLETLYPGLRIMKKNE